MPPAAIESLLYFLLGACVFTAWYGEYRRRRLTGGPEGFWPGTVPAPAAAYWIGAAGALLITLAETAAESRLHVAHAQTVLPAVSIFALIGASAVEESVFRGFAAPGRLAGKPLLGVIVAGSIVFALIHGFDLATTHGRISATFAFITSLWLYLVRFNPLNPDRSLLPCFMAHTVRNLAVFGIKWAEGFVN